MPRSRTACLLLAVLLTAAAAAVAQPPKPPKPVPTSATATAPPLGPESLSGSFVIFDPSAGGDSCFIPGTTQTLCFRAESFSNDWEYVYNVWERFPADWTVTGVSVAGTPACTGGGTWGTFAWSFQTAPFEVNVHHPRYHALSGDHCTAYYCFDVVAGTGSPDALVSWFWDGDGFGSPPHWPCSSDGYTPAGQSPCDQSVQPPAAISPCVFDPIMLTPPVTDAEGCPCELQEHTITVWNNSGADTTVNLTYALTQGSGTCTGPAQVVLTNGTTAPVTVLLEPTGVAGDLVTCQVTAVDAAVPANTDTAVINKTLIEGGFDPAGWQAEPITGATPNQWAGSAVGTHPSAIGPVGYVVGGLGAGSNVPNPDLQMFNPAAGTWTQMTDMPNQRFSPVVGWMGGKLYAAGGYDTAFAATNDLQVFDPVAGTWDNTAPANLPNARGGGAGGVGTCASGAGECLFHVGGGPDGNFASTTQETWQYDPVANVWTQLDNKPAGSSPDGHILGAGVGCLGQIFVGGDYRGFHHFFRLDATQASGSRWTQLAAIPTAAGAMTPTLVCKEDWGAIVLIGGDPNGAWSAYNDTAYVFDIASGTWDGPLPQTLAVAQTGAVGWHMGGKVWTVGGTVGEGAISPMPFESLLQITCDPCAIASISLAKTVGTEAGVCAATTEITVPLGTTVYYCYAVTNTGEVTLNLHDLVDDQLGNLFSGLNYSLAPGASIDTVAAGLSISWVVTAELTNTATWTAYNSGGPSVEATASATVYLGAPATATVTVLVDPVAGGTVTGGGLYNLGDTATVTATPNPGWTFLYWLVGSTQITDNPYSFEVTGDVTLTAVFEQVSVLEIPALDGIGLALLVLVLAGAAILTLRRHV